MEDSTASLYPAQKSHGYPSCWTHCSDISLAQNGYTWWQNIRQLLIGWSISWLLVFCSAQQKHKCSERGELQAQNKSTAGSSLELGTVLLCSFIRRQRISSSKDKPRLTWKIKYLPQQRSKTYKALTTKLRMQTVSDMAETDPDTGLWTDVFTLWLCVHKPRRHWKVSIQ